MKSGYLILIFLFLSAIGCFAQHDASVQESRFEFWVGMENRITPIYNVEDGLVEGILTPVNIDKQLSGTAFSFGLAYRIMPANISLAFEYAVRYDQLYYESPGNTGTGRVVSGLISDYHIRAFKSFGAGKVTFRPGLGYSLMNRGTGYILDNGSGTGLQMDSEFNAFDLSIGMDAGRISMDLRCYLIGETNYNPAPGFMVLPEIKILYRVPLLRK